MVEKMNVLVVSSQRIKKVADTFYSTENLFDILKRFTYLGPVSLCTSCLDEKTNASNMYDLRLDDIIKKENVVVIKRNLVRTDAKTKLILERAVSKADLVVGYLPSANASAACYLAKKHNKKYLSYVVGCPWNSLWNHGVLGKALAPYSFFRLRKTLKKSDYALYVTEHYLQKRYPCFGLTCGCSDVKINFLEDSILNRRLQIIKKLTGNEPLKIATIANNSVKYKGQHYVIKALARLKKLGIERFHYHLIGGGDKSYLEKLSQKLGVAELVHFEGIVPHSKIFEKMDEMHIYAQPSLTEGLPRSVVEAMSRGLLCVCADAGAMPEMVEPKYVVKRKSVDDIVNILANISINQLIEQAQRNFREAKKYQECVLEAKRNMFFEKIKKH